MSKKLTKEQWVKLVARAQQGEEAAFEEICRLKSPSILFICNDILHNWQDAEDATQEILLQMQKSIENLAAPEAFSAWLNRLSVNTCWTMRRKHMAEQYKIYLEESNTEFQDFSAEALPAELLETKDSRWRVMNAIKSLPSNYRMPLLLFYYEGLTAPEIGEVLNITTAVVKNNIQRGRKKLKDMLEEEYTGKRYTSMAIMLPAVLEQTEMLIAVKHSTNVLKAMGFSSAKTISLSAATMIKILGSLVASAMVTTSVWLATGPAETYIPQGYNANNDGVNTLPPEATNDILPYSSAVPPTRVSLPTSSAEDAFQPSQSQGALGQKAGSVSTSPPAVYTNGAAIMGKIYINSSLASGSSKSWNVPEITIQLYGANNPNKVLQTTKTLEGEYCGWYIFESLPPGKYIVKPLLPSYLEPSQEETNLQEGKICKNGQTVFEAQPDEIITLSLQVTPQGSIEGKVTPSQQAISNLLAGITVVLYDPQNTVVAQTTTKEDGSYFFAAVPVLEEGRYSLRFFTKPNMGIALTKQQIDFTIAPGEVFTAENTEIYDNQPPAVNLQINGTATAPVAERTGVFLIQVWDANPVEVKWCVENNKGEIVASGQGLTPGNSLETLAAGSYVATATATDSQNNTVVIQKIIYLG